MSETARREALAIFGPCVGDRIETVDVFSKARGTALDRGGLTNWPAIICPQLDSLVRMNIHSVPT